MPRFPTRPIAGFVIAILLVILAWTACYTVQAESEGVVLRFGKFLKTVEPGLHFKLPIADTATMYRTDIRAFQLTKVNTYTIDNQELDAVFTVNYRVSAEQAERIFLELGQEPQRTAGR